MKQGISDDVLWYRGKRSDYVEIAERVENILNNISYG